MSNLDTETTRPELMRLPEAHLESIRRLETAYLAHKDPILQSGFHGGVERWRAERSPLLDAVDGDGDILDLGCANGYLLECVVEWGRECGFELNPHGADLNPLLIQAAIRRFPENAHQFWVANAWEWVPPKRFRWVYAIWDLVPEPMMPTLWRGLLHNAITDDGALIVGAYGSKSDDTPSFDVAAAMRRAGLPVSGESRGGQLRRGGPVARFAWVRKCDLSRNSRVAP